MIAACNSWTRKAMRSREPLLHHAHLLRPRPLRAGNPLCEQGGPVPASFFDLAVYASYNAVKLRVRQAGYTSTCAVCAATRKHVYEGR